MRKYVNKKYITVFLAIILAILLLGNYFTCPQCLDPIGLDSFNASLIWFKYYKFNNTIIHYSNPLLGEADFGFIVYILTPVLRPITLQDIYEMNVIVKKISEKTYNPLVKGFIITVEGVNLFTYLNDTTIDWYATTSFWYDTIYPSLQYVFVYRIHRWRDYFPTKLYARVDYSVHVIINPYFEIWYHKYHYITTGFHIKIYSGSVTIPINFSH